MTPFALRQNGVVKGTQGRLVGIAEDDVFAPRRFAQFVGAQQQFAQSGRPALAGEFLDVEQFAQ